MKMQNVFIAGCGYIGEKIARLCLESGTGVTCMVRSQEHGDRLRTAGFATVIASLDDPETALTPMPDGTTLFYLVPPPGGGLTDSRTRNFIRQISGSVSWKPAGIIYMSATSVYSETAGGVATERSETNPASAMGKRRLDAETAFLEYGAEYGVPVIILRVSGIYGPGRLPLMQIGEGQPLLLEKDSGMSNRIHADDLAQLCVAAALYGESNDIFNVSDGHPTSMTTYFNACADALGMPRQPQVTIEQARTEMSPLMFSYASESRIVDNSKMLERLKVTLRYPSFMEGIHASV